MYDWQKKEDEIIKQKNRIDEKIYFLQLEIEETDKRDRKKIKALKKEIKMLELEKAEVGDEPPTTDQMSEIANIVGILTTIIAGWLFIDQSGMPFNAKNILLFSVTVIFAYFFSFFASLIYAKELKKLSTFRLNFPKNTILYILIGSIIAILINYK